MLKPRKGNHSKNPVYLSGKYTEYFIKQDDYGFFYIRAYRTRIPKELSGKWQTHKDAEEVLIKWLEKTDKIRQSRYPGSPPRRVNNYTKTFLNEQSPTTQRRS